MRPGARRSFDIGMLHAEAPIPIGERRAGTFVQDRALWAGPGLAPHHPDDDKQQEESQSDDKQQEVPQA